MLYIVNVNFAVQASAPSLDIPFNYRRTRIQSKRPKHPSVQPFILFRCKLLHFNTCVSTPNRSFNVVYQNINSSFPKKKEIKIHLCVCDETRKKIHRHWKQKRPFFYASLSFVGSKHTHTYTQTQAKNLFHLYWNFTRTNEKEDQRPMKWKCAKINSFNFICQCFF